MAVSIYDEVPPSPTLTNPDMILPTLPGDTILAAHAPSRSQPAARQQFYRPQSFEDTEDPAVAFATFSSYASHVAAPKSSPTVVVRPSSPDESNDTTPTRRLNGANGADGTNGVIPSSPTLRMLGDNMSEWPLVNGRPRSGMSSVSSELSEDLERWAANKAALAEVDGNESVANVEDEEPIAQYLPRDRVELNGGSSPFSPLREDADEDFLSRRAEIILANAKSRLKMMEGNLKGARHSLSNNNLSSRYSGESPRRSGSNGHSRAVSEVSLPSNLPTLPNAQPQAVLPMRAASALGTFGPGLSLLNRGGSLRGARSQEAMRENRLKYWMMDERDRGAAAAAEAPRPSTSTDARPPSAQRKSPALSEMQRPVSQASSIRAQMDELKDRIYQIKERANQNSKRLSSAEREEPWHKKTPSPQPIISHTTGPGPILENDQSFLEDADEEEDDDWLGASEVDVDLKQAPAEAPEYEESNYEDAEETLDDLEGTLQEQEVDELDPYAVHYGQSRSVNGVIPEERYDAFEGESESGATEYYEAEQVPAERHEDRFDAFDYQNMFLHSAMSSAYGRRNSYSSESSVETTRPASPLRNNINKEPTSPTDDINYFEDSPEPKRSPLASMPDRNMSSASISTAASFTTAVEGVLDDDDDEFGDEDLDQAIATARLDKITRPMLIIPRHDSGTANSRSPTPGSGQQSAQAQSQPASASSASTAPIPRSPNLTTSPSKQAQQRGSMLLGSPPAFLPTPPTISIPPPSTDSSATHDSAPLSAPPQNANSLSPILPNTATNGTGTRSASSQQLRPSSGLLSMFIGLDNVTASQETIQRDRALVESVVGAMQRCCLELQRGTGDKRDELRSKLEEVRRVLGVTTTVSASMNGGALGAREDGVAVRPSTSSGVAGA